MNENPDRQNGGQNHFNVQRLAQNKPPFGIDAEPVRENLEEEVEQKPPVTLARRPILTNRSEAPASPNSSPLERKIHAPPPRQTNPISTGAANGAGRVPVVAPRPPVGRVDSPSKIMSGVANAPTPVSLPNGIQRGFPRPQPGERNNPAPKVEAPRLNPEGLERENRFRSDPLVEMVDLENEETGKELAEKDIPGSNPEINYRSSPVPFLEEVLDRLASPPAQTAILGVCDDGLPVLVDLNDPAPGAILVTSDDDMLRLRLLRTLIQTSAVLNSPRSVQFLVLSTHPEEWRRWIDQQEISRHCLGVERLPDEVGDENLEGSPDRWLLKLSGWADQRRSGSVSGPAVVMVVDDLRAAAALEYDARVNFDWLVKEGPAVRIWPVVGMRTALAREYTRWVRLFKTRLLGPAEDPALFNQLSADPDARGDSTQFAVRLQDQWLKFRVPILPDDTY